MSEEEREFTHLGDYDLPGFDWGGVYSWQEGGDLFIAIAGEDKVF